MEGVPFMKNTTKDFEEDFEDYVLRLRPNLPYEELFCNHSIVGIPSSRSLYTGFEIDITLLRQLDLDSPRLAATGASCKTTRCEI
jgi:hypothetical protein